MQNINYNLISVALGISIILTSCIIAFIFQKYFFGKYRNKVGNVVDSKKPDS